MYTTLVIIVLLSLLTSIKTYLKMVQECTLEVGHSAIYIDNYLSALCEKGIHNSNLYYLFMGDSHFFSLIVCISPCLGPSMTAVSSPVYSVLTVGTIKMSNSID